jgi:hypothetical protein
VQVIINITAAIKTEDPLVTIQTVSESFTALKIYFKKLVSLSLKAHVLASNCTHNIPVSAPCK